MQKKKFKCYSIYWCEMYAFDHMGVQ
uniref:Uncharacterized protein n=1 Tax=Arundo donax TaxID=35708 RepID=A0A0A9ELD6_ARUDO